MNAPPQKAGDIQTNTAHAAGTRRLSLSSKILLGLAAGIAAGLFFGDECARLKGVGDAFIGLLQMTVLPYITVSLVANVGRLTLRQGKLMASTGVIVLLGLWGLGAVIITLMPLAFPAWQSSSFFSTTLIEPAPRLDLVRLFIPINPFASLSQSIVPAVVVFCICVGVALMRIETKQPLLVQLDVLSQALMQVNGFMVRLTPLGVFALAASAAGTMTLEELGRLQAYLITYTAAVLFLTFWILPVLLTTCTPFRYAEIMAVSRDALITAFATGKVLVVLPLLIENTRTLFEREPGTSEDTAPGVDVLLPLAYPFPNLGKLLSLLFIPFTAWFVGQAMPLGDYPYFITLGLLSFFGGPVIATPFLLDVMELPNDMFHLFLIAGIYCNQVGDMLAVMHLLTFSVLTTCLSTGLLRAKWRQVGSFVGITAVLGLVILVAIHTYLNQTFKDAYDKDKIIVSMQLLTPPVPAVVADISTPNPKSLRPGQSRLSRIRERGVIRIGFNPDKLPFAYVNRHDTLVGFDIDMAHRLAGELGVTIEFVPFERDGLAQQLSNDHFDLVMSGIVGTLERAEQMRLSEGYLDVTMALVVPDYHDDTFSTLTAMQEQEDLKIGVVSEGHFAAKLRAYLPHAQVVTLPSTRAFFEGAYPDIDAMLLSAESGSAWTLLYPAYQVVNPFPRQIAVPLVYPVGGHDKDLLAFLEHWLALKRKDGSIDELYDHWILGRTATQPARRWSVIRDVLRWID